MSAVQFNLLPDVKLDYIKAERSRNLVVTIAILVSGVAISIFLILLLTVDVLQKKQLSDADKDIKTATTQLKAIPNLDRVLTIQNQLRTLASLHQNKHQASRLFSYLPQVTPTNAHIGSISLDFASNIMTISGTANSQHDVNVFIDTLKFTTFKTSEGDNDHAAFPSVVESSFSITGGNAGYSLNLQFDPELFSAGLAEAPKLNVPKLTTTRSVTDDPANVLFNGQVENPKTPKGR